MNAKAKARSEAALPTADEIRDYAYHLYVQSGCAPGRDLENWLEAETSLAARIAVAPAQRTPEKRKISPTNSPEPTRPAE